MRKKNKYNSYENQNFYDIFFAIFAIKLQYFAKFRNCKLQKWKTLVIYIYFEQYLKALFPIEVIDEGIVVDFKEEHPLKAHLPIFLTDDGIEKNTLTRDVHF